MRITRYTDYSLRVLLFLAVKGEEQSTIGEIAQSYGISKNHLMKVVQELNSNGYVVATRGRNGGLRLKGRPEDINIGTLVRGTEQDLALVECFNGGTGCVISPACELKKVLAQALEAFFAVLDGFTLADILPERKRTDLIRLLAIEL